MTRFERNKLNRVIIQMPPGIVLTLIWLKEHGVSCKLAWWYVQSHWLERVGNEAYKKYNGQVQYYETNGLQQAALIIRNARLGFEKGDVSYIEWTLQMNNAVNIELGYVQAIHALNNTIIELEYLTGK